MREFRYTTEAFSYRTKIEIKFFIILLISIFSMSFSQKVNKLSFQNDEILQEVGAGVIQEKIIEEKPILYNDSQLKEIIKIDMISAKEIVPFFYKKDYNILYFLCIKEYNNCYKIKINKDKYAYLKKSSNFVFYSWNSFIKNQIINLESKNIILNPAKYSINGYVVNIKHLDEDETVIENIDGDWVYIKNNTRNIKYWIRWKNRNKILVYFNLLK